MKTLNLADLFCGAGGTSSGAIVAAVLNQNPDVSFLLDGGQAAA